MNSQTRRFELDGPIGKIECLSDEPQLPGSGRPRGVAIIAHPHPLFGGTMDNKVVQTLARAFVQCGWRALRFNFRGVGNTRGQHDEGRGETDDFLAVVQQCAPDGALALGGFSFGSFVASQALHKLWPQRSVEELVFVATAASRFAVAQIPAELRDRTLLVHGELDDTVPLIDVLNWARPQVLPVTVVPAGSHFFHGQLPLLKSLITRHLGAAT